MRAGYVFYPRSTRSKGAMGDFSPVIAAILTTFVYAAHVMSPPPIENFTLAWMALVPFAGFTTLAAWLDHTREPRDLDKWP